MAAKAETPTSNGLGNPTAEAVAHMMNGFIHPDNPNVRLENLDDVLDACFLIRAKVADLYNRDIESQRSVIRDEERKKVLAELHERLDTKQSFEKRVSVNNANALKEIIKQVKAYDHLKETFMGRLAFIEHCKKQGIASETADLIFISQTFDVERRRQLINDNLMLLAE